MDTVLAVGAAPADTLRQFSEAARVHPPQAPAEENQSGEAVLWLRASGEAPFRLRVRPPLMERRRHIRKYAAGELGPDSSFYFQGPDGKLNLRAQNLYLFLQIGEGVDDDTWTYHLRKGDYSRWFREKIKDEVLADEAVQVEARDDVSPRESRALIRKAIERRYTLPVSTPLPVPGAG